MALTHAAVLSAAPRPKTYKIHDRLGLFLEVTAQGGKRWRAKFRFANRENRLSLGIFPMVGLRAARLLNAELRAQIASGVDPSALRKQAKRLAHKIIPLKVSHASGSRRFPVGGRRPMPIRSSDDWRIMYFPGSEELQSAT
jgi:hypothetical protein